MVFSPFANAKSYYMEFSKIVPPPSNPIVVSSNSVCLNAPKPVITFTASSSSTPFDFVYTINRGKSILLSSSTNSIKIEVPTNSSGTFIYTLVSYKDGNGVVTLLNDSISVTVDATLYPDTQIKETESLSLMGIQYSKFVGTLPLNLSL